MGFILDETDKKSLNDCDDLILTITEDFIYLDNWNYEQECQEEITTIEYTEDNLFLLKEDLKGFDYRELMID